ncbi:MAG: M20/M25/M40 family metallo-hydrolase, partial [Planctomycetes bacterium]|nr:M20/M25/M40 family metallo-hydrolase [Planctomycetota bacterium]
MDRALLGEIYASDALRETLFDLCDRIGPRFAGSAGERAAALYVRSRLRAFGLRNATLEPFAFQGWTRGRPASVEVRSPLRRTLPALALPYSPDTGPKGTAAPLSVLPDGTPEDFRQAGRALRGSIVLVREGVPPGYPRAVHRAEKFGRSVAAGARGFLFANPEPGGLEPTGCARFGREAEIPAAGLSREAGDFLRRLADRGPVKAVLRAFGATRPARSQNVFAEIPGRSGETLIVGGHLDSHDISPGAVDNAAGICVVLEAARALSAVGFRPAHTIRFVAFGAEEVGLLGSQAHARRLRARAAGVRWMVNVDCPPQEGAVAFEIHRAGDADPFFRRLSTELGREVPAGRGLHAHSDHYPFFLAGIPVANLAAPPRPSARKGGRGFGHTAADTPDKVDLEGLRSAADVLSRTLVRLAG